MNATDMFETEIENTDATTPANLKNDKRMSDLNKLVKKLGEEAADGKDSLPKLAHAVVKAAADGVITGPDAGDIYKRYAKAESSKAIHEHSAGGLKANTSKLRQLIDMGNMTTVDGVIVMDEAKQARDRMIKRASEPQSGIKLKAAYPFYVDVARAQLKSDTPLSADFLEELAVKGDNAAEKSVEKELTAILKRLEALVTGEGKHGLHDEDEDTEAAYHLVKSRLDKFATLRAHQAVREQAAALGLQLA